MNYFYKTLIINVMDGLNKMEEESRNNENTNNRLTLYQWVSSQNGMIQISMEDNSEIFIPNTIGNIILTGLSYESYREGNFDLITLYKGMKVYEDIINGYPYEVIEFIDKLIELFSIDLLELNIQCSENEISNNVKIKLCNGMELKLNKVY